MPVLTVRAKFLANLANIFLKSALFAAPSAGTSCRTVRSNSGVSIQSAASSERHSKACWTNAVSAGLEEVDPDISALVVSVCVKV